MNRPDSSGPDSGFYSATSVADKVNSTENKKILTQLECLRNILKTRMNEFKMQENLTKDLEEELEKTKMDLSLLQEKCNGQDSNLKCNSSSVSC